MKTVRDAVWGDIRLTRLQAEVMDTRSFQRLRGIRQLGMSHLVYPSAMHSRFEHSLGTCWVTRKIIAHLAESSPERLPPLLSGELPGMVALLHDITHVPFGHTLEDERRLFQRHDVCERRLKHMIEDSAIGAILERAGLRVPVMAILSPSGKKLSEEWQLVKDVVSGPVGADLLDYLRRDALFCGLDLRYDDRVFNTLALRKGRLIFDIQKRGLLRQDALSELIHLLRMRYSLTERVYYHHAKIAAGAMVSKVIEILLRGKIFAQAELFDLNDQSLLHLLEQRSADIPAARALLEALASRRLHKCVYMLQTKGLQGQGIDLRTKKSLVHRYHLNLLGEREALEKQLTESLGLEEGDVIVYCPAEEMALKEARMPSLIPGDRVKALDELKLPEIEVLLDKHRSLWRFRVLLARRALPIGDRLSRLCRRLLGRDNHLPAVR